MTASAKIHDERLCQLGEGPLWHPLRGQLFWFDIPGNRLLSRDGDQDLEWRFDEHHSAAGWIDENRLLIASETGLWRFDIATGAREPVCALEADNAATRSNDGRADRQGGFWIGTMGKAAERGLGAIYRYYRGELRQLHAGISVPNSICFSIDGRTAYFADTPRRRIMRQGLDDDGWPATAPEVFIDLRDQGLFPDGSVIDASGGLWNAQWGAGRVARYAPDGTLDRVVNVPGRHSSCPAFGGDNLQTLFVTTAREGIDAPDRFQGLLYSAELDMPGHADGPVVV